MKASKRRLSKKKKAAWRKHIDDSDVDAFFEDQRFNERCGKAIEEKTDAELFSIDKKPKSLIRKSVLSEPKNIDDLNLKCFSALQNTSAVPDPLIKRNTVRTKEQRQHPALKKKNEIKLKKGILKKKEINQLQKFFYKRIKCMEQNSRRQVVIKKDLWEEDDNSSKLSKAKKWMKEATYLHTVRNTSDLTNKSNYRPEISETIIPTFEPPHPGTSYNPTFQDHFNLADSISKQVLDTEKEEAHLTRVTQKLFKQITADQNERNWLKEMAEGLPLEASEEKQEMEVENVDDTEYKALNAPVRRDNKKTIKQRKKELQLKKEELKQKEMEEQKKKAMDIDRLDKIQREILKEELKTKTRSFKKCLKEQTKCERAQRVGKNKFVPEETPISDVQELAGCLREIIPQGNILKDRLCNMQKRSLIEVTKPQFKRKKRKMKKYRLKSHRLEVFEKPAKELLKAINNK